MLTTHNLGSPRSVVIGCDLTLPTCTQTSEAEIHWLDGQ